MLAWCSPQLSSIQASHPRPRCGRTQNKNCNSETHNFVTHSICPRLYYLNNCDLLLNPRLILLAWPGPRSQQNKNCKRLHFDHQLFVYRFVCVLFLLFQYLSWYMDGDPFSGKWWDACSNSNAFVTLSIWSRDYYLNNDLLELFILRLILLLLAAGSLGPQTNTEKGCILYSWTILFRGIKSSTHNLMLTTVSLLWFSFSEASLRLLLCLGPQTNKLQKITRFYREHISYSMNSTSLSESDSRRARAL